MTTAQFLNENSELIRTLSFEKDSDIVRKRPTPCRVRIVFVNGELYEVVWLWYEKKDHYISNGEWTTAFMTSSTFWEFADLVCKEIEAMKNTVEYGTQTVRSERNPPKTGEFREALTGYGVGAVNR